MKKALLVLATIGMAVFVFSGDSLAQETQTLTIRVTTKYYVAECCKNEVDNVVAYYAGEAYEPYYASYVPAELAAVVDEGFGYYPVGDAYLRVAYNSSRDRNYVVRGDRSDVRIRVHQFWSQRSRDFERDRGRFHDRDHDIRNHHDRGRDDDMRSRDRRGRDRDRDRRNRDDRW